jgi:hypothetical protein
MERYKDLEGDYTKKTQAIAKYKKRQDAFDEIMAPFKSQFETGRHGRCGGSKTIAGRA